MLRVFVGRVANETHDAHTVGNHNKDDTHILRKGEKEVAEVVTLNDWVLVVEMLDLEESMDDMLHCLAIFRHDLLVVVDMTCPKERGDDRLAAQSYLIDTDTCRL